MPPAPTVMLLIDFFACFSCHLPINTVGSGIEAGDWIIQTIAVFQTNAEHFLIGVDELEVLVEIGVSFNALLNRMSLKEEL